MRTLRQALAGSFVLVLALAASTAAEERHAVNPSTLADSVTQHVAQQDADRAAIHEALARPEVRQMAERAGLDLERVNKTVDTLTGESLQQMASAAHDVNQALVGGASTVVISTTTIIIALLIVIIIIVAT
jgi:hypothetical protein